VRRPDCTLATVDHNVPYVFLNLLVLESVDNAIYRTASRKNFTSVSSFIAEPDSRAQCVALEDNVKEFGLTYFGMKDRRQGKWRHTIMPLTHRIIGIVHVIGPEQGFTVCRQMS
jgi:3-isopropylmalate dehydratase